MGNVVAFLGPLKGIFYVEGAIIDDRVFKLHYGFTTLVLFFMTAMSIGEKISINQSQDKTV